MVDPELIFTMLAEKSTKEIAHIGGEVARNAQRHLEH
jgi:hypothetical protein